MTTVLDTVITRRAAAAATGGASRPRPAAHPARAWIETRTARAQVRSQRQVRNPRPYPTER